MTQLNEQSLTSDKDYLYIQQDGQLLINSNTTPDADSTFPADPSAPFAFASFQTVTHGLGSVPLVRAFWDPAKNGLWYNARLNNVDPWLKIIATTTQLKLIMNTDGGAKTNIPVFYRIYDFLNVAVNSDSRVDKIITKDATRSVVVPASPGSITVVESTLTIAHGLGEVPIWSLEFSEDGVNWYQEGGQIVGPFDLGSGPPGGPYARYYYTQAYARADSSNFYITGQSNYATQKTLLFRFALDYRL